MKRIFSFFCLIICFSVFFSCNQRKKDNKWKDTPTTGVIPITCDESFQPIIQSEIDVFESLYPMAGIVPIYTDEVEALSLLLADSIRFAVVSRTLTEGERAVFLNKKMVVRDLKIAVDAVALIVNKENPESVIGVPTLKKILMGEIKEWKEINPKSTLGKIDVLFDRSNSSTVRYAIDSICKGAALSTELYAQGSHQAVVDMVAKSPNSLGFIGVNWISNDNDTTNLSFLNEIRVLAVGPYEYADENNCYLPFQAYIALGEYPLIRDVYILLSDPRSGLSSGFASFVVSDRGQRIIKKSGILPATQPINLVHVKDEPVKY
jgi:phosphate transport system substrate-binding protein